MRRCAMSDRHPLRQLLDEAIAETGTSATALTVMSPSNDPFRLDIDSNHRDGKWLAETIETLGLTASRIHIRGLHYAILGRPKPDGTTYVNDENSWKYLVAASNVARWLGYIDFEQIIDQRNAEPVVRIREELDPEPYFTIPLNVKLPSAEEINPKLAVDDFEGVQAYRLAVVGEKSSLEPTLGPIADRYDADLYLPTGDISNTLIYRMAKAAADDGRPLRVFYFADCDPSGHNMGIVLPWKLRALTVTHFPDLNFEVHRVALTVDQVRSLGLPSTPLKDTEKRADKWRAALGVEQTEIDALATLMPDVLRKIARDALKPFYDHTLNGRVRRAKTEWLEENLRRVNEQIDNDARSRLLRTAEPKLAELRREINELSDQLRLDTDDFDFTEIVVPQAETQGLTPAPLFDSTWSFVEQIRALKQSKSYGGAP
jgi:hypothetical protein